MTLPIPTSKQERWKYSNLAAFVPATPADMPLVVNYVGDTAFLSSNIETKPYVNAWAQDRYGDMQLWDIASIYIQDVMVITIPDNVVVEDSIVLHMAAEETGKRYSGHIVVRIGKNASLTLHEEVSGNGWLNRAMTVELAEGARLVCTRFGAGSGIFTPMTQIHLAATSYYNGYNLLAHGSFVRDQIHAILDGEGAECLLSGSEILKNNQHADTTILIEHYAPHCHSYQNYRNLLDDRARGVFQGKVHVHRIGQGTDGYQLCNTILLSERAEMDTKPELEIYADDVKCSHGATTAQPDETPLFYLQSRGIPLEQAKKMLIQAFIGESLESFENNEVAHSWISDHIASVLDNY